MKNTLAQLIWIWLILTQASWAQPPDTETLSKLQAELVQMRDADQAARKALKGNDMDKIQAMWAVDAKNQKRLKEIIKLIGWPTKRLVGDDASEGAFLIAQHAADDFPLMEMALTHIEAEFNAKQVPGAHYAMMYDRVQVLNGKPQKYGTQFTRNSDGCVARKLAEPDKVEQYRAQLGLDTFAAYAARVCK